MNIPKAIEILDDMRDTNLNYYSPDRKGALTLGIEALKRCREVKQMLVPGDYEPLLGETED